jgi:uncharacterized membrane protein YdbT with pleckstrin-like domain
MIDLKKDEKIISLHRRHIFIIILELLPIVFASITIIGVAFFLAFFVLESVYTVIPLIFLITIIFLHMLWIVAFIILADYYLDIWILTNDRLITIEQKGLFSRKISEFELPKIQEVSVDVSGFFPTLLNYGNVRVRTASENPDFIFKQVGDPNKAKDNIMKEADRAKREINFV